MTLDQDSKQWCRTSILAAMQPMVYPFSPWRGMLFLLGSLAFVAGGIWMFTSSSSFMDRAAGVASVAFFGIGVVKFTGQLLRRPALLTLSADGISQPGMPSVGWSDIDHVRIVEAGASGHFYIDIVLRHPQAYFDRITGPRAQLAKANQAFGLGPAVISNVVMGKKWPLPRIIDDMRQFHPALQVHP